MLNLEPKLDSPGTGVVVTGAASGTGLAAAQALAAVGRSVALCDITTSGAVAAAEAISKDYDVPAIALTVDPQAIMPAVSQSRRALGRIGGLVHAAGSVDSTGIDGVTPDNWDAGLALHGRSILLIVQALRDDLRTNPGSAIVALSSINATLGSGLIPIYSAAKGAVNALVRSMADELARDGVRINAVSPGQIETPLMRPVIEGLPECFFERRILLDRLGQAEEVGRLIRFLLSDEASYITAAEIVIDGGNVSSVRQ